MRYGMGLFLGLGGFELEFLGLFSHKLNNYLQKSADP
jgi:hypothetical protein